MGMELVGEWGRRCVGYIYGVYGVEGKEMRGGVSGEGQLVTSFGREGSGPGRVTFPRGLYIAVDYYVASYACNMYPLNCCTRACTCC